MRSYIPSYYITFLMEPPRTFDKYQQRRSDTKNPQKIKCRISANCATFTYKMLYRLLVFVQTAPKQIHVFLSRIRELIDLAS